MRDKLARANLNHCAVDFLSRAAANLWWYYYAIILLGSYRQAKLKF